MPELDRPQNDGLEIPEVGPWSRDKHHFLHRYIKAFITAMKQKRWSGLHYIDPFAGAGLARIKGTDELDWGSPLIAARANPPFDRLHLCEKKTVAFKALTQRLQVVRSGDQLLCGDANQKVHEIVDAIPRGALSLAFLDPYGLHLDYETLRAFSTVRSDLIIFFPDRIDAHRNWRAYYWLDPNSNLDAVLGPDSDWRHVILDAPESQRPAKFRELYEQQIRRLGYTEFEYEGIPSNRNRLYWLIFCSRHRAGRDIWRGVSEKKRDGQRTFLPLD